MGGALGASNEGSIEFHKTIPIEVIRSVDIRKRAGPVTSFAIVAGEFAYLLTAPRGRDLSPAIEELQVSRPVVNHHMRLLVDHAQDFIN